MSVVGIITEYNPLHEGHAYHLNIASKITGASVCVCILSSNFVQRGEPALVHKWARAQMALSSGANLVLELPSAFSCASAEYFASGAVKILESLNCIDYLCFGSEEGNITTLERTAEILAFENDDFKKTLRLALDEGLSFAVARQKAIEAAHLGVQKQNNLTENAAKSSEKTFINFQHALTKPNNILGIEYIKAIKRLGSSIKPITIERIGHEYHSPDQASSLSSATAIRQYLKENTTPHLDLRSDPFLQNNLPQSSLQILSEEFAQGRGQVFPEAYEGILLHLLRRTPESELSRLPYMGEGLENRLKQAAMRSVSYQELLSSVVTSRYPASRIKRIFCALLTGMTGEFLEELKGNGYAQYIRVLGFNETGRKLLASIKKKAQLPLITKPSKYSKLENPLARRLFEHEIHATDVYVLGYANPTQRLGGTELTTSPLYIKS